ncbi:hypothetical protein KBT16_24495 [Nostoc sp. CCCryo 231-06]|nr:hypothetical protein [Nostoc sp. CCCryo 231-06]
MSTTGYAYAIISFSLLKIDGGAIGNAFPGSTWERRDAINRVSANFYLPNPLPRELEGRQMQFSS